MLRVEPRSYNDWEINASSLEHTSDLDLCQGMMMLGKSFVFASSEEANCNEDIN
jgi:hypothetical protein